MSEQRVKTIIDLLEAFGFPESPTITVEGIAREVDMAIRYEEANGSPNGEDREALTETLYKADSREVADALQDCGYLVAAASIRRGLAADGEQPADEHWVWLGDDKHPDWQDYVATNLLAALDQVAQTGDWWAAVRMWCERHSTGCMKPLAASPGSSGGGEDEDRSSDT